MRSKRKSKPSRKTGNTRLPLKLFLRHSFVTVCFLTLAAAFSGCALLQKESPEQRAAEAAAQSLLSHLTVTNQNLKQFKGIGRIQLEAGGTAGINERVVWAAAVPSRLSVVVLASGLPILKFASDGQHLYLIDMRGARDSFHKIRTSDPSLARLMSIPVRTSDIVHFLAGRLPVRKHTKVRLAVSDTGSRVLILQRWRRVVQKVYLDARRDETQMVEFFDGQEQLAFRVVFEDLQNAASYQIPGKVRITGSSGAQLLLRIERLFPDVEITDEMFILRPPDRGGSAAVR